jgi:hypothetical protein
MGIDVKTFTSDSDVETVGNAIADWLLSEKGFVLTLKGWKEEGLYEVKLKKSGFFRQASGLVYSFDITLQKQRDFITLTVNDGDIRKQLVGLGVAIFVLWPMLITAGYGWMHSGELRQEVLDKVTELLRNQDSVIPETAAPAR